MRIAMTTDLARAVAQDAADLQMRLQGRTVWNREDYSLAVRVMDGLLKPPSVSPQSTEGEQQ